LGTDEFNSLSFQACRSRVDIQKDDEVDMGVNIPMSHSDPVPPTNTGTTSDAGGINDDYTGRKPEQFWNDFNNPLYRDSQVYGPSPQYTGYQQTGFRNPMNMKRLEARELPRFTSTSYASNKETTQENIEVFQIPCFNDFLVMFSSPSGM
jgi:hypothetical protein